MIDFHTHSLPEIDDGSRSLEESISILEQQKEAGVKTVLVTPHFYPDQEVATFEANRTEARARLQGAIQELGLEVRTGAEVLLSVDTCQLEHLEALCIEGTRYILLEMPYSHWSDWVYTSVEKVKDKGFVPIIAHVERYDTVMDNPNCLIPFLEMGCVLQLNTVSLHKASSRRKLAHKLVKHGFVHILGSDVHKEKVFHPVSCGYKTLQEGCGQEVVEQMQRIGVQILENKKVDFPVVKPFKKILGRWY
ncbi:tyrosine-protein phosphatase [Niameybacter sp.]|uniref:tyrosine-protein phosphatase n=1 Tax=Niameybacter sp. TaxID=2033640 RepID=UPI002FCC0A1F